MRGAVGERLWTLFTGRCRAAIGASLRQADSADRVAGGLAIGVFFAASPFVGLQALLAIGVATLVGANRLAAVAGTLASTPVTAPLIYLAAFAIGTFAAGPAAPLPAEALPALLLEMERFAASLWHLDLAGAHHHLVSVVSMPVLYVPLMRLMLGAAILGALAALVTYPVARRVLAIHQEAASSNPNPASAAGPSSAVKRA
ncbi:MAG: DUF2062 domain-containing protein [Candidatus Schekmanbacteria bacterium]|nr:DUF2062 domain-containing protein [Candidatus Schekmanbacteria bacterium]